MIARLVDAFETVVNAVIDAVIERVIAAWEEE